MYPFNRHILHVFYKDIKYSFFKTHEKYFGWPTLIVPFLNIEYLYFINEGTGRSVDLLPAAAAQLRQICVLPHKPQRVLGQQTLPDQLRLNLTAQIRPTKTHATPQTHKIPQESQRPKTTKIILPEAPRTPQLIIHKEKTLDEEEDVVGE